MQEREELLRRAEETSHQASNMRALMSVLKLQLGVLNDLEVGAFSFQSEM